MKIDMLQSDRDELRRAVADYMQSEGCSCCSNETRHKLDEAALGTLLDVPMYDDGSGYDFNQFASKPV